MQWSSYLPVALAITAVVVLAIALLRLGLRGRQLRKLSPTNSVIHVPRSERPLSNLANFLPAASSPAGPVELPAANEQHICPRCGSPNRGAANHCSHCGVMFTMDTPEEQTTRCTKCGSPIPTDHGFCGVCGMAVGTAPSADALGGRPTVLLDPQLEPPTPIIIQSAALCDCGRVRSNNEDSLGLIEGLQHHEADRMQWGIYVVSDGMGGHEGGEVASALGVKTFLNYLLTNAILPRLTTDATVDWSAHTGAAAQAANQAVFDACAKSKNNMGATLVAATLYGNRLTVVHIGDSRAYCWDGTQLQQLTEDHSLIAQLVAVGEVRPEEARSHPQRSVLLQSLGQKQSVQPTISEHTLRPNQRVLLCSDGLHGMLDDHAISTVLAQNLDPQATCQALIDAANAAGGDDNVSALIIACRTLSAIS
ncbi:MAG: protein phosphatase 2C domain-containing protein [Herpetosiphonaceae bacterium]|nr:protein phosphatase 2C domain-containing protein [Herpetosiphonaceae bacterium]